MEGSRPRGKPRLRMLDDLITLSYGDMKRKTEDRGGEIEINREIAQSKRFIWEQKRTSDQNFCKIY